MAFVESANAYNARMSITASVATATDDNDNEGNENENETVGGDKEEEASSIYAYTHDISNKVIELELYNVTFSYNFALEAGDALYVENNKIRMRQSSIFFHGLKNLDMKSEPSQLAILLETREIMEANYNFYGDVGAANSNDNNNNPLESFLAGNLWTSRTIQWTDNDMISPGILHVGNNSLLFVQNSVINESETLGLESSGVFNHNDYDYSYNYKSNYDYNNTKYNMNTNKTVVFLDTNSTLDMDYVLLVNFLKQDLIYFAKSSYLLLENTKLYDLYDFSL